MIPTMSDIQNMQQMQAVQNMQNMQTMNSLSGHQLLMQQPQNLLFQPPKFGPAMGNMRSNNLLNINEYFSDYYFPQDGSDQSSNMMQQPGQHFDSSDSDFLNFLCAPELSQQSYMPQGFMNQNIQVNQHAPNMMMMPIRVQPLPRSTIPLNSNMLPYMQGDTSMNQRQGAVRDSGLVGDIDDDDDDPSNKKRKNKNLDVKNMTAQQRLERRERNREHAKQSRIRKKVLLDTLQDQLTALRTENTKMRRIVAERIPEHAQTILERCTTEESRLLESESDADGDDRLRDGGRDRDRTRERDSNAAVQGRERRILMEPDFRLIGSLVTSQQNFVVSDPSLPDNPIVYCSEGFCKLTGYKRTEVLGRNCRFLQGPETDQRAVDMIRQGITEGRDVSVCLLNYKADGSTFWNQFFVAALCGSDGQIVNYVGVQCEVNTVPVSQMKDRVKKLPLSYL
uniref:Putative LOV domain-containing protein n=1 Tax=Mallomonas sp. BC-2016 TaxID=1802913 RepID=A0A126WV72_9STRA|nr:putative LOV domain-containing protein [Mallomonas sp. BC-2016]